MKPWDDNKVRTALKICQHHEKILALAYMNEGLQGQDFHVYQLHPEYCEKPIPKYDPQRAQQLLKEAGYATGHFGKWHMGGQRDVTEALRRGDELLR